jgi:hypothetical protein
MSTSRTPRSGSSSIRRQLAAAHAELRDSKNALYQVEHPLRVRIGALEAEVRLLRRRLEESRREMHAITVLARTINERAQSMTLLIENHSVATGNPDGERP